MIDHYGLAKRRMPYFLLLAGNKYVVHYRHS